MRRPVHSAAQEPAAWQSLGVVLAPVGSLGREELPRAVLQPALRTDELDMGPLKIQGTASPTALPQCLSRGLGATAFERSGGQDDSLERNTKG